MKNLLILSGALFLTSTCFADVVNFDDVTTVNYIQIVNGYHGFNWSNFYIHNSQYLPASGYSVGVVSGTNVAFNGGGNPATVSSATTFTFTAVDMTAAWDDGLSVLVEGFQNGVLVDSATEQLSAVNPGLFRFNWTGLTSLEFITSGGTQHSGYTGLGGEIAFDDMILTADPVQITASAPEPSELPLLGIGLAGVAAFLRRR